MTVWTQPLHWTQEIHALLPATPQHHAAIHCEEPSEPKCEKPDDDVSQPLSGAQHERHHEARCSTDGHFFLSDVAAISAAPQGWDVSPLVFLAPSAIPGLAVPALAKKSRAPPQQPSAPLSVSFSLRSGRAPPIQS